jgi:glycosyltransferase involved in cell wall biosynthesis
MKNSSLTIAGNDYLKNRAIEAGATNVIIIPTVIDLKRYKPKNYTLNNNTHLKLIWIGNPSTVHYLEILKEPLIELSKIYNIKLIIVGASFSIDGVSIEEVLWSEDTENAIINSCDVGLMPLIDSPWERGKCGYKLIQYMASGLPVIASDVGANSNIIKTDYNGFLVNSTSQWIFALNLLLKDKCLRKKMGINGRKIVADKFSLQKTAAEYVKYLKLSSNKL